MIASIMERSRTTMMELVIENQCTFSFGEFTFRYMSQRLCHSTFIDRDSG